MSAEFTPMSETPDVQPVSTPEPPPSPAITVDGIDPSAQAAQKADDRPTPPHALEQRARKHRVKDIATPADVPKIRELSSLLKELTPADENDVPRVRELKAKFRAALEMDDAPKPAAKPSAPTLTAPEPVSDFSEPEPTIEQFADKDDPYGEHLKAWSRWDRRKEAHDAKAEAAKADTERFQRQTQEEFQAKNAQYGQHLTAFKATTPDYDAVLAQHANKGTPILFHALLELGESGPKVTYDLMKHPTLLDELILLTDGKPITSAAVATTQRILTTRLATGSAGAVAPSVPVKVAPKPPSPARTGPMTPSDKPPGDDADLDEHRRYYGVGGRRHRGIA